MGVARRTSPYRLKNYGQAYSRQPKEVIEISPIKNILAYL
jgi:hypothetical protein